MKKFIAKILLIAAILVPSIAIGSIAVSPLIVTFDASTYHSYRDITVKNTGKKTAYVGIKVYKVTHPGTKQEKKEQYTYQDPKKFGLLVPVTKMRIPVKQQRTLRIIPMLHQPHRDVVFNVLVTPVEGKIIGIKPGKKGEKSQEATPAKTSVSTGLHIVVAFLVRVFIRPPQFHNKLRFYFKGRRFVATNEGNSFNSVHSVIACQYASSEKMQALATPTALRKSLWRKSGKCTQLFGKLLYAKTTLTRLVPKGNRYVIVSTIDAIKVLKVPGR